MFRAASRLPTRALLATSTLGAIVLQETPREKLSIYPSPNPDIILVETPSALETQIGVIRRSICQTYSNGHAYVQGWVSRWIGVEHAVERRVKSIVTPQESLTPGLLYVGVATLTGSILARNRRPITRLILPPVFFAVSAKHFLPKTTHNLSDYLGSIEDAHLPAFAEKHEIAKQHSAMTWDRIKEATQETRGHINRGALNIVEKIQEATGLKLRETLGLGEEVKQHVEEKVAEVQEAVEKVTEEVKTSVNQKVEEVKTSVNQKAEEVKEAAKDVVKNVEQDLTREETEKKGEEN
ncbi:hypothetical protein Agabi119p4_11607 [Agaricus bisporus var. burnettii]|uniref:MICOS complex subunit n=1 Tax=Agaricus bisporus var. burnettii TaxID=192524 RepID=A0A8H7EVD6_AGABI|nr:hypothetical protein Agabi119p4_11607 [Agaricus bisporus var. burnettii]